MVVVISLIKGLVMRRFENIPTELLQSIDTMNTINGGVAQASINVRKYEDHMEVIVFIPGTRYDDYTLQLNAGQLLVLNDIRGEISEPVTRLVTIFPIWNFIDYQNIQSYFKAGKLIVDLPYNELAGNYSKEIDIKPI
jgi:HSP20 family molecular chaperone IbpA